MMQESRVVDRFPLNDQERCSSLPEDLVLGTETERYAVRLASTIAEMQDFYDAIAPRAEDAIAYCDRFTLDALPGEVLNLMHLLYSMVMVSFPIEVWRQPRVPDSGSSMLECYLEPTP